MESSEDKLMLPHIELSPCIACRLCMCRCGFSDDISEDGCQGPYRQQFRTRLQTSECGRVILFGGLLSRNQSLRPSRSVLKSWMSTDTQTKPSASAGGDLLDATFCASAEASMANLLKQFKLLKTWCSIAMARARHLLQGAGARPSQTVWLSSEAKQ